MKAIYMLILGGRYGSIEPTSGLSYTELEYDYAASQGKPLFAVVTTEEALEAKLKQRGSLVSEKSEPKALALFRSKVLSNISSFFSDAKDVRLCVYESLSDLASNNELRGWVSGAEIEDTQPLHDEIKSLREQNASLSERIGSLTRTMEKNVDQNTPSHEEIADLFENIEIKLPEAVTGGKANVSNLLDVAYFYRDRLVTGLTSTSSTDIARFLYLNILPKLQAHGLAETVVDSGAKGRRALLNKAGLKFFAEEEKRKVLAAKAKQDA